MPTSLSTDKIAQLLSLAYAVALRSPDTSTQNGALIWDELMGRTVSIDCNRFPTGFPMGPEHLERPLKYTFIEHAERNSLYNLHRYSEPMPAQATMVAVWAACADCGRGIVESGVETLVRHKWVSDRSPDRWIESIEQADSILLAGGVEIINYDGAIDAAPILHNGELWSPRINEVIV